jgi:patatin-related protein
MSVPAADSKHDVPDVRDVREIRLGLVCYGGVSLAIYMHGITKELQKLVLASRALEDDPQRNPFPPDKTEHAYWEALRTAREHSADHALPRVVIDVVAGTSAGGINGIFLCKALAHNLSQDSLRELWFTKADIRQLLGGSALRRGWNIVRFAIQLLRGKAQGLLDGKAMLGWLLAALKGMDGTRSSYAPKSSPASLIPDGHSLQLHVTTTDYFGYRQPMTIHDPPTVAERRNRHILSFLYQRAAGEEASHFDNRYNGALAFSARSTSSFPGAFPPLHIADLDARELPQDFEDEFFRAYELSEAKAEDTYFMDGGVLNNYPFRPAIDTIFKMRAESEVTRYLLYLQPDPGSEVPKPEGGPPNYVGTIWAGLSSVAAAQPILEELIHARDFNERVRRVDELVASTRNDITRLLESQITHSMGDQLPEADAARLRELRLRLDAEAEKHAGYLYSPYLQLRAHSVVEQFATGICQLCNYREEQSNVAFLVRLIVDRWARGKGLVGETTNADERARLLDGFDLGYTRRRLAFVLQGLNTLYGDARQGALRRQDLDRAKKAVYDRIDLLKAVIGASRDSLGGAVGAQIRELFPATQLADAISKGMDLEKFADDFVERNGGGMDAIAEKLGAFIRDTKNGIHLGLYQEFRDLTANWTPSQRAEVMMRYLGFPFWDAMIYPVTALSEAGELRPLQIVRVSPLDSTRMGLSTAKDKLEGVKLAHFGAFLRRKWRENDYLWGRLDAAERLIGLVLRPDSFRAEDWEIKPALAAVLAEDKQALTTIQPLIQKLETKVASLPDGPPARS